MAKGVKKIKWADGRAYLKMCIPDKKLVIPPDEWVWFKVGAWEAGTTDADKTKNLTWMRQEQNRKSIISQLMIPAANMYGLKIAKKDCGPYTYYIEASLSGKQDSRDTGLYVGGWCEARIISSKWCEYNGGPDKRSKEFSFGNNVCLNLATEGLNGNWLTVEIYRLNDEVTWDKVKQWLTNKHYDPTRDDAKAKVYEKQAHVIDGEINVDFTINSAWKFKEEGNQFYIKVRDGRNYIKDNNGDYIHARFLKVDKNVVPQPAPMPILVNNTPVKVGQPDKNSAVKHTCTFTKIQVTDNEHTYNVFDEGKFDRLKKSGRFYTLERINYDFDKWNIRADAKPVLDKIAKILVDDLPYIPVELGSHTDCRGTDQYNQTLSEKRARSVVNYLIGKGVDEHRIFAKGYGKTELLHAGEHISDELHEQNRRTTLKFLINENDARAIIYETIAPDITVDKKLRVDIADWKNKGCYKQTKHQPDVVRINKAGIETVTRNGHAISENLFSRVRSDFPRDYFYLLVDYLNPFATIFNKFDYYINSCAYYSNNKSPSLSVRAYPDLVWIGHFQYNYKDSGDYFFHEHKVDLTTGIREVLDEYKNSIWFRITKILPTSWITENVVMEYIAHEAESYTYGAHVIRNRTLEKPGSSLSMVGAQTNLLTETSYSKYAAAAVIYCFVVVGIIIDLLLIYLTRGKNLEGRIAKIARKVKAVQKVIKNLNDAGVEIVPPAIAINGGMYYYKRADGELVQVFEANLKANPLVAVDFKREFSLCEMLVRRNEISGSKEPSDKDTLERIKRNKENNDRIINVLKKAGVPDVKGEIQVRGEITFEHKVKCVFLTQKHPVIEIIANGVSTKSEEVLLDRQISFSAEISGSFEHVFRFDPFQTLIAGKLKVTMKGAVGIKLRYGVQENKGLFMTQILHCSGIQGTYLGSAVIKNDMFGSILDEATNDGEPMPFTLIAPFEVPLYNVQLFSQPT